ncbi:MAG: cryptochrome/photolyase family protein [Hyphomonadaceae bacterium]|nr:cryptochrome/photolyase family protein [Hyphomonadaceae bacterium]
MRLVLGDQLSPGLSALRGGDKAHDLVLLAEVHAEATYVRHHKKKIAFLFAAMRKFAAELGAAGWRVRHVTIEDPANTHAIAGEVARACAEEGLAEIITTECGEWRLDQEIRTLRQRTGLPLEVREDDRFLCSKAEFARWAEGRKSLRMEYFYREMRRKTGLLMEDGAPVGGQWNYDQDNRARVPKGVSPPSRPRPAPDTETQTALELVARRFPDHFGELEPFGFATDRAGAEAVLEQFLEQALPSFGRYQDAMLAGEPWMWHGLISFYLNAGLLDPLAVCRRAERELQAGRAPLNSVEGFIRQIIGWREYVRGIYWLLMPEYARRNYLDATGNLPAFYWTGETDMRCMGEAIGQTIRHAYAHHIQRLMVTGNFALLAGCDPAAVNEWYLVAYADAYEWVELPNTHGMILFADGGVLGSKPYAASGKYIDKMSDYCGRCRYDVKETVGPDACPFNALYWDFLMRNEEKLKSNPRLAMPYKTLARWEEARKADIRAQAQRHLQDLGVLANFQQKCSRGSAGN